MKIKIEKEFDIKQVGNPDFGLPALYLITIFLLLVTLFRTKPPVGIGLSLGVLISQAMAFVLNKNNRDKTWWTAKSDGISEWRKFSNAPTAQSIHIAFENISSFDVKTSLTLSKGVLIKSNDGKKIWIPQQTDHFFKLIDLLSQTSTLDAGSFK